MTTLTASIIFIVGIYIAMLLCIVVFDKRPLNINLNRNEFEILPNYWLIILGPICIYCGLLLLHYGLKQNDSILIKYGESNDKITIYDLYLYFTITFISSVIILFFKLRRYYLLNDHILIILLLTRKQKLIPQKDIFFAEYIVNSNSVEYFIRCDNKNLVFKKVQITSEANFRNYFLDRKIPYFQTDWTKDGERIEQKPSS